MGAFVTAVTGRSLAGADVTGPVRHAVHYSMPRNSRTGRNYRAACRASVRTIISETWDPTHERACAACRATTA